MLLAACAGASAAVPPTAVAGVQLDREVAVAGTPVDLPASARTPDLVARRPVEADPAALAAAGAVPRLHVARPGGERARVATIGGVERRWTVVVPPNAKEDDKLPILVVLHGVGGVGTAMRWVGFEQPAAAANALVVYPDASGGSWNDGRPGMEPLAGTPVDDVAFLRELLDRVATEFGGDLERASIVGFSNGALMASRAACDMPERLRAVVLVSGAGPRDVAQRCRPSGPLSVMIVFGTGDATVPYNGGQVAAFGGKSRGQVSSVRELLDVWRAADRCGGADVQETVSRSPLVTSLRLGGCTGEVVHYCIVGGKHEWVTNAAFNTTTESWKFVAAHWA